jgi:pyrroline-5-carboxylate reductase
MRIGFIGAGQMARALASGFVMKQRVAASEIVAADCYESARSAFAQAIPGTHVTLENREVADWAEIVFLAVKPQQIDEVCLDLKHRASENLIVSIAAGITLGQLQARLGSDRVVRVMPNTPCLVGAGAAAYCRGPGVSEADARSVAELLETVGRCWELPEQLMDAVTGLSGSGPAFVFQFIEALSDGGVRMGLPRSIATQLAAQTVLGSAQLVLSSGEHPAELKDRVASPAGTTIAGLHALEQSGFRAAVMNAVQAATERSRELGGT